MFFKARNEVKKWNNFCEQSFETMITIFFFFLQLSGSNPGKDF